MDAVIQEGTAHIARAAETVGARLIHLSTDVVFDGRNPPYDESAQLSPTNAYGRAKARAESLVMALNNHVVVRTSLIYGLRTMDHGTRWIVEALRARQPVRLFNKQRRNPVWVKTLCLACLELADNDYVGVLNVAGNQVLSRAEFALRMLDWWNVSERDSLTVAPSEGENWPLDCELNLKQAAAVLSAPLLGVDDVLAMFQKEMGEAITS
jgi:dTDP-4-dehydrorhamnose reductase